VAFNAGILGTGAALPDKILTNSDLETFLDTSDEWIQTRTGIRERRIATPDESNSTFSTRAAKQALKNANIDAEDIDLLILATVTPDMPLPATSCIVQAEIGATRAAAFDLSAACSGFIYGMTVAEKFIKTGSAENILVIGSELLSKWVDWEDRTTAVLFADGAGAVVMGKVPEGKGLLSTDIRSDGNYVGVLNVPAGGTKEPFSEEVLKNRRCYIKMKGNELFKVAIRSMANSSKRALQRAGYTGDDVALVIPHQANQRITDGVAQRLKIENERVYSNIGRIGNSSSATIPIGMYECLESGRLKEDDLLLITAFGGGATWASAVIRW
jgi:3-oxoacyl-[acyl-carrier-protein] synthase-3